MKSYIGIDLGKQGAISLLRGSVIVDKIAMPSSLDEVYVIIRELGYLMDVHAIIERVHAMPGQGVSSMFSFGKSVGHIEMALTALRIPFTAVPPQTWQKELHKGIDKKLGPKERSRIAAVRLFPHEDFRASSRCKVAHNGIIDSVLLAEYGRRKNL